MSLRHPYAAAREREAARPDAARIGRGRRPDDEAARFVRPGGAGFTATVGGAVEGDAITCTIGSLAGADSPLPRPLVAAAGRPGGAALAALLDLLADRPAALRYRAWSAGRPEHAADRDDDELALATAAAAGLAEDGGPGHDRLADASLARGRRRSAEDLARSLAATWRVPVRIRRWTGARAPLPVSLRLRVGEGAVGGAAVGATIGDPTGRCEVVVGPVSPAVAAELAPGGAEHARLVRRLQAWTAGRCGWRVRLVLDPREVRPLRVGIAGRLGCEAHVGAASSPRCDEWTFDGSAPGSDGEATR